MKRKMLLITIILSLFLSYLVACAKPAPAPTPSPAPAPASASKPTVAPAPAPASTQKWIFAQYQGAAPNNWGFDPLPIFQPLLEEMTGGRLVLDTKIELFSFGEDLMGVAERRADAGNIRLPFVGGSFPQLDFASLPFYFEDIMELQRTMTDPEMIRILEREFDKLGLVYLGATNAGPENGIWGNRRFARVEDFKGVKIRTSGFIQTNTFRALGASPLTMMIEEIADAITRGTVDAVATSLGFGVSMGMPDVVSDVAIWTHTSNFGGAIIANKASFNALPKDLQDIVKEWGKRITQSLAIGQQGHYLTARNALTSMGLKVTVPDKAEVAKARALTKSSIDLWLQKSGLSGKEILAVANKYASGAK